MKLRNYLVIILASLLSWLSTPSYADQGPTSAIEETIAQEGSNLPYNYGKEIFNTIFSLGLLVAILGLILVIMKRFIKKKVSLSNDAHLIKIIEKRSLSNKSHIYAIGILDRLIVIGESQEGLHAIAELDPGTHLEALHQIQVAQATSRQNTPIARIKKIFKSS